MPATRNAKNTPLDSDIRLKRLARILKSTDAARIRDVVAKDTQLNIRLSRTELTHMKQTAASLGLTLSEYLIRIHWLVSERLENA